MAKKAAISLIIYLKHAKNIIYIYYVLVYTRKLLKLDYKIFEKKKQNPAEAFAHFRYFDIVMHMQMFMNEKKYAKNLCDVCARWPVQCQNVHNLNEW